MVQEAEFENWMQQQSKWLQTAAAMLINNKSYPNIEEIERLANICYSEAAGENTLDFETIQSGFLSKPINNELVKFLQIKNIKNINALSENTALDFNGENLIVVYGANASGKSGYSRLIKHACSSISKKQGLLPNVYSAQLEQLQSATFTILKGEVEHILNWNNLDNHQLEYLQRVHIFDTFTTEEYLYRDIEASYEPSEMRFISTLVQISDQVRDALKKRKDALVKSLPEMPFDFRETEEYRWFYSLSYDTNIADVENKCVFREEDDSRRFSLEKTLKEQDHKKAVEEAQKKLNIIKKFREYLEEINLSICQRGINEILNAQNDAKNKRRLVTEDAEKIFKSAILPDVGKSIWQIMWQAARKYSEDVAYVGHAFPYTENDSHCVLCQQKLDLAAAQRMRDFEKFIKGDLEQRASIAEEKFNHLLNKIPNLINLEDWSYNLSFLGIDNTEAEKIWDQLNFVVSALKNKQSPKIDANLTNFINFSNKFIKRTEDELKLLRTAIETTDYVSFKKELISLKAKQWIATQKNSILTEVKRLKEIKKLGDAERSTNTKGLTQKKDELAEKEIVNDYCKRFMKELEKLCESHRIPVKPKKLSPKKGKVNFSLQLDDTQISAKVYDVLSEGESKIVTLASFLSDITVGSSGMPIIFDDPITSLDHYFQERVAKRLVELSNERQVIVFTHRLSFLTFLEEKYKKYGSKRNKFKEIFIYKFKETPGIVGNKEISKENPDKALNILLTLIKSLEQQEVNINEYQNKISGIINDFRIIIENVVEKILLNKIVLRSRRDICTKNKLYSLVTINSDDCKLIDEFMSRYSCGNHAQNEDTTVSSFESIELNEKQIKSDILILQEWIKNFQKRQKQLIDVTSIC